MNKKKMIISVLVALLASVAIFISIDSFVNKKINDNRSNSNSNITSNSNSNDLNIITKKTEVIDFKKYQELRSDMYDSEVFAIVIMKSDDKVSNTFKDEVLNSFNKRKCNVYELDIDKLNEKEVSEVITDITKIQKYKEPTMITPTMIVSKKGKIVYVQEGLIYASELNENLDKQEIE
jgi:hypothetical protein